MKFTITGSLGNISKPLTELLVAAGHQVTVVSSSADKRNQIEALGATPAIGSIEDIEFLTKAFTGADAIYTMVPPNFGEGDYRAYFNRIADNYIAAIKASGVNKVVNLSSIGADLPEGTGPIAGLHDVENKMNTLQGVSIKHLRASFFYVNLYSNIGMMKELGIMGSNYSADTKLVLVHPADIAKAASEELQKEQTGHSVMYVASDERTAGEVAEVLGKAVNKPAIKWVGFTDEQALGGMMQAGVPLAMAEKFVEMGAAAGSGVLAQHYYSNKPAKMGATKLEDFAREFAVVYNQ